MSAASELLEIPEVRARISPVTPEQYRHFPELNKNGRRTELIRGFVIEKMSKPPLHTSIASALYDLLRPQVPAGFWLRKEEPLTLRDSEPEPDLSMVRGTRSDFALRHPETAALVIEIAVTPAAEDRSLAALYAEADVTEYWIVLPTTRQVEIYRQPEAGKYREVVLAEGDDALACASLPSVTLALRELF